MTLTPEQLDAIATKLLGWKPNPDAGKPFESYNGEWYSRGKWLLPDGSDRDDLRLTCPGIKGDAMLVLEAMGKADWPKLVRKFSAWECSIESEQGEWRSRSIGNTIPEAVFKCAAKLVERM